VIWILNFHIFICKCYCIGGFQKSSAGMGFCCKTVSPGICCYGHNGLSGCCVSFWIQSQLVEERSKPGIPLQCLDGCRCHGRTCRGRFVHVRITSISMNDNRNHSSIFMLEEEIDIYLLFCLREFQGSILNLLMEFSSKSLAICCRMMNILVEVAEFWILLVLLVAFFETSRSLTMPSATHLLRIAIISSKVQGTGGGGSSKDLSDDFFYLLFTVDTVRTCGWLFFSLGFSV
jgi:hypothetical protein